MRVWEVSQKELICSIRGMHGEDKANRCMKESFDGI
jgi:hypothetical protein